MKSYVNVVAEPRAGVVLEPALVHRAVQNAREHRVPRALVLYRGVVEAPAPATAARGVDGQRGEALVRAAFSEVDGEIKARERSIH